MSSTSSAHQNEASNTGEPSNPQYDPTRTASTTATVADVEPTPEIPPKSPHRPRPESQTARTEGGTVDPGLGRSTGQLYVRQANSFTNSLTLCRLNRPPSNTDLALQAHGAETTNVGGDPDGRTGGEAERPIEEAPPPAYSEHYGEVDISQDGFDTQARVASVFR